MIEIHELPELRVFTAFNENRFLVLVCLFKEDLILSKTSYEIQTFCLNPLEEEGELSSTSKMFQNSQLYLVSLERRTQTVLCEKNRIQKRRFLPTKLILLLQL